MARYLIDTDVIIDVSRRNAAAANFVDSLDDITISIITAHELIVGARNRRDADSIDSLIKTYPVHRELGVQIITGLAYELLKRHAKSDGLRTFDALIAATAIKAGFTLVSRNATAPSRCTAPWIPSGETSANIMMTGANNSHQLSVMALSLSCRSVKAIAPHNGPRNWCTPPSTVISSASPACCQPRLSA